MSDPARFLSRWSRLKRQAAGAAAAAPPAPEVAAAAPPPATAEVSEGVSATPAAKAPPPSAAAIEQPDIDSDFGAYLQAEADETLRRQALKKLFADPHFNVMDGLDTYIDDYSISDPIPEAMLAGLNQMKRLFPSEAGAEASEGQTATADGEDVGNTSGERDITAHSGQNDATPADPAAQVTEKR